MVAVHLSPGATIDCPIVAHGNPSGPCSAHVEFVSGWRRVPSLHGRRGLVDDEMLLTELQRERYGHGCDEAVKSASNMSVPANAWAGSWKRTVLAPAAASSGHHCARFCWSRAADVLKK